MYLLLRWLKLKKHHEKTHVHRYKNVPSEIRYNFTQLWNVQKSSSPNFFGDAGTYGLIYLYFLLDGKIKSKFQNKLGIGKYVCNILLLKISGLCLCKVQYLISKCDSVKFSEGKFLSRLLTLSQSNSERLLYP